MKTKIYIVLLATALAFLTHGYLVAHYYPLHYGFASGDNLCNVNAKLNCDAVSASAFSSLFGIPIAAFGASFNAFLFALVLLTWLGVFRRPAGAYRFAFWLGTLSVLASAVMASISIFSLSSYCLFYIAAYGLSIVGWGALWSAQSQSPWSFLGADLKALFSTQKTLLFWLLLIPGGAALAHMGMVQNYGAEKLAKVVETSVSDWNVSPTQQWTATPSLVKGASPENAKMTIVEFADFRCGHCKLASPSLNAFTKANPDVRLIFYAFPLDSKCNPAIDQGDGISCLLARTVLCSGRQERGWEAHEEIFNHQSLFHTLSTEETVLNELRRLLKPHDVNWDNLMTCVQDPQTDELIRTQANEGAKAKIRGTPTIFVNGRLLERGQVIPVLEAVRKQLTRGQ